MGKKKSSTSMEADAGAAMLVWYAKAIGQFPEGLVSQAQAAVMLGISRMAVSRLVTRGELRAVYFPEVSDDPERPEYVGVAVGPDDPMWLRLVASISDWDKTYSLPKAAFVAFGDVVRLWKRGDAKERCKPDWNEVIAAIDPTAGSYSKLAAIQAEKKRESEMERRCDADET